MQVIGDTFPSPSKWLWLTSVHASVTLWREALKKRCHGFQHLMHHTDPNIIPLLTQEPPSPNKTHSQRLHVHLLLEKQLCFKQHRELVFVIFNGMKLWIMKLTFSYSYVHYFCFAQNFLSQYLCFRILSMEKYGSWQQRSEEIQVLILRLSPTTNTFDYSSYLLCFSFLTVKLS